MTRSHLMRFALSSLLAGAVACSGGEDDDDTTNPPRDGGVTNTERDGGEPPRDGGEPERDAGMEDPILVSITVEPDTATLDIGATQGLTVTGTYDDSTSAILTDGVTYRSSDDLVATVSAMGLITAVDVGSATITVSIDAFEATVAVTVNAMPPDDVFVVFDDDFGADITFADFGGSNNMYEVDNGMAMAGTSSLRVEVPAKGYTGGAFAIAAPQDLTMFNALTFWARSSSDLPLNVTGIANDGNTNVYQAELNAVPLTATWTQFVIPIPDSSRLSAVNGLFHFAEGSEDGAYTIWFDQIQYEVIEASRLGTPMPAIATETIMRDVGATFNINGTSVTTPVDGNNVTISARPPYFTFASSMPSVATVDAMGVGTTLAEGSTDITGTLAGVAAAGTLTVNVAAPTVPTVAAPTPTVPAGNVISLYSNAYTNSTIDTWSAVWDSADVADVQVAGDDNKLYTNLVFAGIEFVGGNSIDASAMTHFHMDIWTADSTVFRVKLVDFGADNAFGGGDDTEHELTFDGASTPPLATGQWMQLELPMTDFVNLANAANISQIVIVGSTSTVYVDNVYFHN
jgi:uncharacterized protein YjdB